MRKLIVAEQISLDGIIQSPGAPNEDPSGDFRFGGWVVPYADDAISQALQDLLSQPFELLLGRRTYDIFAAYWPHVRADSPSHAIAERFNRVPKHVATHRADSLDWYNSHALEGDLAEAIRALTHRDGVNLLTWGSGEMVRQLLAAGLVDELRLLIFPVVLARGKRLFGDNAHGSAFTLTHSTSTPGGVLITRYVRGGEVRTGTFESSSYDLTVEETIAASPKAVLDGFIDMYGKNRPAWIHRSELDLRVGGVWTVDFGPPGPPAFHEDRVITAYQPGRRLAYAMTATYVDAPRLQTTVEIECEPLGRTTRISLRQRGFPTGERRDLFDGAWREVLALLKTTVERGV